ncbi:putative alpha/beta hydrolase-1 [Helianthus anomalus]
MEGIEHKTISVNGLNIHIAEKGQGQLVLFLHGFPELWYSWRHQIVYLADLCSTGTPFMWPYPSRVLVGDGNTMGTRWGRFLNVSNVGDFCRSSFPYRPRTPIPYPFQCYLVADHGYRAVAPDLRGYGDTTGAPVDDHTKFTLYHVVGDLIGLLDAITSEGEKVFVVGHDWGAFVAWHLCMFRPDRVKALVNLSVPFIHWDPMGDMVQSLRAAYGEDHYVVRFQVKIKYYIGRRAKAQR